MSLSVLEGVRAGRAATMNYCSRADGCLRNVKIIERMILTTFHCSSAAGGSSS